VNEFDLSALTAQPNLFGRDQSAMCLRISDLGVTYPNGVTALDGFTLDVACGEFVAVVGPSGCGKSTLLRVIAGLQTPTRGQVTLARSGAGQTGIVFQDPTLLPWRTVEENIRLPMEMAANRPDQPAQPDVLDIQNLINLVGLQRFEKARPRELSGGMAQRVALARALARRPPILLLDEPFGALDALTREGLTESLQHIWQAAQTTCLMVTHTIAEAIFLADKIAVCSSRPGHVAGVVEVALPRPRYWEMESLPAFGDILREVRALLNAGEKSEE